MRIKQSNIQHEMPLKRNDGNDD